MAFSSNASSADLSHDQIEPLIIRHIKNRITQSTNLFKTVKYLIREILGNHSKADDGAIKKITALLKFVALSDVVTAQMSDSTLQEEASVNIAHAKLLLLFINLFFRTRDHLIDKQQTQDLEQLKQLYITQIYTFGNEEDKKFLKDHFSNESYYTMLSETIEVGGQWVYSALTALMQVPTNLSELYNAWSMSRSLHANKLEKATYVVLNRLAASDPYQQLQRFKGPSIEPLPDIIYSDSQLEKGKEKNNYPEIDSSMTRSFLGKSAFIELSKPEVNFHYIINQLWDMKSRTPKGLQTFEDYNLNLVHADIRCLDDAEHIGYDLVLISLSKDIDSSNVRTLDELREISKTNNDRPVLTSQNGKICIYGYSGGKWKITELNSNVFDEIIFPISDAQFSVLKKDNVTKEMYDEIKSKGGHTRNITYYNTEEIAAIKSADNQLNVPDIDSADKEQIYLKGIKVKAKHVRQVTEAERLNGSIQHENPFDAVYDAAIKQGKLADLKDKLILIKSEWYARSKFALLSSTSIIEIIEKIEHINSYVILAQAEIKDDRLLDRNDRDQALHLIQELGELVANYRTNLISAMLERLKFVPTKDLMNLNTNNGDVEFENKQYCDDVIYHTLVSLIECGLSAEYVRGYARQTSLTNSLTVTMIAQFNSYISIHGNQEQKNELARLYQEESDTYSPNQVTVSIPTNIEGHLYIPSNPSAGMDISMTMIDFSSGEKEENSIGTDTLSEQAFSMQRNNIRDASLSWLEINFDRDVNENSENTALILPNLKLKEDYSKLPHVDVSYQLDEQFEFVLIPEQEEFIRELSSHYFKDISNRDYFVEKVKDYLSTDSVENYDGAYRYAYAETVAYLIEKNIDLFPKYSKDEERTLVAINNFTAIAVKASHAYFDSSIANSTMEEPVIDFAYNTILKIENTADQIKEELLSQAWKESVVNEKVKTYLSDVYEKLNSEEEITPAVVSQSMFQAKLNLFIESHVTTVTNEYQEIFKKILRNTIQFNGTDESDFNGGLDVACKALNLIGVLKSEKNRVEKSKGINSKQTTRNKITGFSERIFQLENISGEHELASIQADLLRPGNMLTKKRGWFSLFPCTKSTTEKNLKLFIDGNAPESWKLIK